VSEKEDKTVNTQQEENLRAALASASRNPLAALSGTVAVFTPPLVPLVSPTAVSARSSIFRGRSTSPSVQSARIGRGGRTPSPGRHTGLSLVESALITRALRSQTPPPTTPPNFPLLSLSQLLPTPPDMSQPGNSSSSSSSTSSTPITSSASSAANVTSASSSSSNTGVKSNALDFKPEDIARKTVAVPLTVVACKDFARYREITNCDNSITSIVEWLLIYQANMIYIKENNNLTFPHANDEPSSAVGPCITIITTKKVSHVVELRDKSTFMDIKEHAEGEVDLPTIQSVSAAFMEGTIKLMFAEMLTTYQTKGLKPDNLASFYAQKGLKKPSERVHTAFHQFASNFNDTRLSANLGDFRRENAYVKYHTTAVSSPQYVINFIRGLPTQVRSKFTLTDVQAWENASIKSFDARAADGCNMNILLHAYCYGKAAKMAPDSFYQAEKVFNAENAGKRKAIIQFYTNLQRIISNEEAMAEAKSLNDLMTASSSIW